MAISLATSLITALSCLSAGPSLAAASAAVEDAACALQVSALPSSRPALEGRSARAGNDCDGQVQMDLLREVVVNNLGGLGPTGGDPVIKIRNFVTLPNGQPADLVISNLTEYSSNAPTRNGLMGGGDFNVINSRGSVDLLFSFEDTSTGLEVYMPPFNLTIYDLDGPAKDVYAEIVAVNTNDFTAYNTTASTDVIVGTMGAQTSFGSSALGVGCDNPSSIASLGVVVCNASGTVDQRDRSVALKMVGGKSSYHISLITGSSVNGGRNFFFGVPAFFEKVCQVPTPSPTPAPTPSDVTSAFGDPHVSNLKGERFNILQTDYHTFLVVPRGSTEEGALLHVLARVEALGEACAGLLFVTSLRFSGRWIGDVGSLEFGTSVQGPMDAQQAIKIKKGASSSLNISEFKATIPQSLAEITEFHPEEPKDLNHHVDTLLVKLKLGPSIAKVRMVYQKEKAGFSNSLWLTTSGMRHISEEIGGILGLDDHTFAASIPKTCPNASGVGISGFLGSPSSYRSIHAAAQFEDDDRRES